MTTILIILTWRRQLGGNPTLCQVQQYGSQYGQAPTKFTAQGVQFQNPCLPASAASLAPGPAPGKPMLVIASPSDQLEAASQAELRSLAVPGMHAMFGCSPHPSPRGLLHDVENPGASTVPAQEWHLCAAVTLTVS